ncbi:dienelactone hydrolase family protein [Paeniglutamicibacter cryotolerans]|uniref:Dienelactone hydrolase n=1 Tax=Paeniglutamicibacter cryotolerans TaxID=670079 RepID=A0A839QPW7_9MICC|nr:dienelactone hydrolase family protein [Paeniglutamicibacter cryotolerans]MBB2996804.1 dienelactone hydrolase [Paeniglutamicibacter cryotolerans]
MATFLIFHHAQGRTTGMDSFAELLRDAGHDVHAPDYYSGHTFTDLASGLEFADRMGFDTVIDHGTRAAMGLPAHTIYIRFSLGVLPAQKLAQIRPGAAGAILVGSCLPLGEFAGTWPRGVPAQIHAMDADPVFVDEGDLDAARDLVRHSLDAELFLYRGASHLFTDSSLPSYDHAAAQSFTTRVLGFLDALQ